MASEALGVTTQKLNDMLENGEVLADELLPRLADVMEKRYGLAAADAGNRVGAGFERLGNAVERVQRMLSTDTGFIQGLSSLADKTANILNDVAAGYDNISKLEKDTASSVENTMNMTLSDVMELEKRWEYLWKLSQSKTFGVTDQDLESLINTKIELDSIKDRITDIQSLRRASLLFSVELSPEDIRSQKQEEILTALSKLSTDTLVKQEQREISSSNKKYNELVAQAQRHKIDIAQIVEEREKAVTEIQEKYRKKRQEKDRTESEKLAKKLTEGYANQELVVKSIREEELKRVFAIQEEIEFMNREIAIEEKIYELNKKQNAQEVKNLGLKDLQIEKLRGMAAAQERAKDIMTGENPLIPEGTSVGPFDEYLNSLNESLELTTLLENTTVKAFQGMEDALVEFITTGKLEWKDYANAVIEELTRIFVQQSTIQPLASSYNSSGGISGIFSGLTSLFSFGSDTSLSTVAGETSVVGFAKGGIGTGFNSATNKVFSSPTFFPNATGTPTAMMATGGVVIGEGKKSEAVLPLTNIGGELGVKSTGESNIILNVKIENNASDVAEVSTAEITKEADGKMTLNIMVDALQRNPVVQGLIQKVANQR